MLFRIILVTIEHLSFAFGETIYWKKLIKEFREKHKEFQKLASTESFETIGHIALYLLSQLLEDTNDAFEDTEEYLKGL